MPIFFHCPNCRREFAAPDQLAGQKARCGSCGSVVGVPFQSDELIPEAVVTPDLPAVASRPAAVPAATSMEITLNPKLLWVVGAVVLLLIVVVVGGNYAYQQLRRQTQMTLAAPEPAAAGSTGCSHHQRAGRGCGKLRLLPRRPRPRPSPRSNLPRQMSRSTGRVDPDPPAETVAWADQSLRLISKQGYRLRLPRSPANHVYVIEQIMKKLTGGGTIFGGEYQYQAYDLRTGQPFGLLMPIGKDYGKKDEVSPDGRYLLLKQSKSGSASCDLWSSQSGQFVHALASVIDANQVPEYRFAGSERVVISSRMSGSPNQRLDVFSVATGQLERQIEAASAHSFGFEDEVIACSPGGKYVALVTSSGRDLMIWDLTTGSLAGKKAVAREREILHWRFRPTGSNCAL